MSKKISDVWDELADSSDEAADLRARAFYLRAIQAAFRDATMLSVSRMKPADAAQYEDLKRGKLDLFSRERLADIALSIYGVEALSTLVREGLPTQAWRASDFVPLELSPAPTTKVEAGFCVFEGKHHPTVTLTLPPCHPDDNEAWNNRDSIATWLTTQIANSKAESSDPSHQLYKAIRLRQARYAGYAGHAVLLNYTDEEVAAWQKGHDAQEPRSSKKPLDGLPLSIEDLLPKGTPTVDTKLTNLDWKAGWPVKEQQPQQSPVWDDFENLCRELMRWLAHNQHPHTHIVITSTTAELSEGIRAINTNEYLVD